MDYQLLEVLACPICKGKLKLTTKEAQSALICRYDKLAYPIVDGIPVMLTEAAEQLTEED